MIENKSLSVHPNDEQATIDLMQHFGWELKSSQEINTKDSHLEERGNSLYSVTTTQNYVKLVFGRDTNMNNYSRLCELEKEFDNAENGKPYEPSKPGFSFWICWLGLCAMFIPGIIYLIIKIRAYIEYKLDYSNWQKCMAEWKEEVSNKKAKILGEAVTLL